MGLKPRVAKRLIGQKTEDFMRNRPSRMGLPDDILVTALSGYSDRNLSFSECAQRRGEIERIVRQRVPEALIVSGTRRSLNAKRRGAAIMVYHPTSVPYGKTAFFGAYCDTFLFCEWGMAFLQTIEPVATTGHLHQRMLERSGSAFRNFSESQDALSAIWPALIELGQIRRRRGERANLSDFISPWDDGLMFGDFSKLPDIVEATPHVTEFRNGIGVERYLHNFYATNGQRMLCLVRTFIGANEMRPHQIRLKSALDEFTRKNRDVLMYLKFKPRFSLDIDTYNPDRPRDAYPDVFAHSLAVLRPAKSCIDQAMEQLDQVTKSDDWLSEAAHSKQNREGNPLPNDPALLATGTSSYESQ